MALTKDTGGTALTQQDRIDLAAAQILGPFATLAALQSALPAAAALQWQVAQVGSAEPYALYQCDGAAWGKLLSAAKLAAVDSLVSGAWNLASSGTWRPAALGALPRFAVNGGASGGTWAISYRNAAGTVTSDPAETVAAGASDVSPVFLDDATEIMVTITGTVTVEVK